MLEDVFLTYGNHSLKEDPERLLKMFDEFENVTGFMGECPGNFIYEILSNVITLIKCDSLEIAKERRKKQEFNDREAFETAFEAVYGYRDGYCQKECYTHKTYLTEGNIIANEKFSGPARLKCYECKQFLFASILADIVEGKEFSEIGGLFFLLFRAYQALAKTIEIIPLSGGLPFKEAFAERRYFDMGTFGSVRFNPKEAFNRFLIEPVVGYSLGEFLLHDDRRRLKRCDECEEFYISKTIRQSRFCSDKCRLTWHNRKRIESGQHKQYKRRRKEEGKATPSYW